MRANGVVLAFTWGLVTLITILVTAMYVHEVKNNTAQALGFAAYGVVAAVMIPAASVAIFDARQLWDRLNAIFPESLLRNRAILKVSQLTGNGDAGARTVPGVA